MAPRHAWFGYRTTTSWQSEITLDRFKVYASNHVKILFSWTFQGIICVNCCRQTWSLNFQPVQGFIFVKHHRLGGSICFQPVCDNFIKKTLYRSEVKPSNLSVIFSKQNIGQVRSLFVFSKYISYNTLCMSK